MNITDALEQFIVQLKADGRSPHTVAQYARHIRAFEHWLVAEKRPPSIHAITPELIASFFVSPAARCTAQDRTRTKLPTSLNAMRSSFRNFFAFASDVGLVASNPARRLRRARCGQPPPRALTRDDRVRLLTALEGATDDLGKRDHVFFHLLLATGLRVSSALALRLDDVDLDSGEISVRDTKGSRPTRVFLGPAIQEHLREFIGDRKSGFLFPGRNETPLDRRHAHRRLRTWFAKATISKAGGPHVLRHTFATDLYERTGDLNLVKAALNHASIGSTVAYARVSDDAVRTAMLSSATA